MAIKAQALADFVAEFTHDIASEPEITSPEVDVVPKDKPRGGGLSFSNLKYNYD